MDHAPHRAKQLCFATLQSAAMKGSVGSTAPCEPGFQATARRQCIDSRHEGKPVGHPGHASPTQEDEHGAYIGVLQSNRIAGAKPGYRYLKRIKQVVRRGVESGSQQEERMTVLERDAAAVDLRRAGVVHD